MGFLFGFGAVATLMVMLPVEAPNGFVATNPTT